MTIKTNSIVKNHTFFGLYIFFSNKNYYFYLKKNKKFIYHKTTVQNKFVNFSKLRINLYVLGLHLKLFLMKKKLSLPKIFFNKKNLNGNIKIFLKSLLT